MFKRILISAAMVLGLVVPAGAGVALMTPGVAHAVGACSQAGFTYEEDHVWVTSNARVSPYNDFSASDSYGSEYPSQVRPSPSGSYYYFGKWDLCWTVTIDHPGNYYAGKMAMFNEGSGAWLGVNAYYNNVLTATGFLGDIYATTWNYTCYYATPPNVNFWTMVNVEDSNLYAIYQTNYNDGAGHDLSYTYVGINQSPLEAMTNVGANNNPVFCG